MIKTLLTRTLTVIVGVAFVTTAEFAAAASADYICHRASNTDQENHMHSPLTLKASLTSSGALALTGQAPNGELLNCKGRVEPWNGWVPPIHAGEIRGEGCDGRGQVRVYNTEDGKLNLRKKSLSITMMMGLQHVAYDCEQTVYREGWMSWIRSNLETGISWCGSLLR